MIDRLSGRVALLLSIAAVLLIVLLGWFVLISPERSKAATIQGQLDDTQGQIQAVTDLLNGPAGRQALVQSRLLTRAIPNQTNMSQILRQFSSAAQQSGVELDGVTPGTAVVGVGAQSLPITVTLTGHYFGLQKFMRILRVLADVHGNAVQAPGRLYSVTGVTFTGSQSSPTQQSSASSNLVGATVTLNTYVYTPTQPGSAPTTTTTGTTQAAASGTP